MNTDTTLLVTNLSTKIMAKDVTDLFVRYGPIMSVCLNKADGIAIVKYEDSRDARDALALNGHELEGKRIKVEHYEYLAISNSDEIMNTWFKKHCLDRESEIRLTRKHIIPLSIPEFINWLCKQTYLLLFFKLQAGRNLSLIVKNSLIHVIMCNQQITIHDSDSEDEKDVDDSGTFEKIIHNNNVDDSTLELLKLVGDALIPFCDLTLKEQYDRVERIMENKFQSAKQKWKDNLQGF